MCWSAEASTAMAAAGFGLAIYTARKGEPVAFWGVLGFFSLMEVIQAASYPVLGQCQNPANQWLTRLAYLHISLHPFAFNALAMQMIPADIRARIRLPVYALCAAATAYTLAQLIPFAEAGQCATHRAMCGTGFCTLPGVWHLAWEMPVNGWGNGMMFSEIPLFRLFPNGYIGYGLGVTFLPLLYGAWRITAFQFAMGPVLSSFLTPNINEQPAIWCLMSVGIAAIIIFTPLRRALTTRSWPVWRLLRPA